jgi:hypothetical protein
VGVGVRLCRGGRDGHGATFRLDAITVEVGTL